MGDSAVLTFPGLLAVWEEVVLGMVINHTCERLFGLKSKYSNGVCVEAIIRAPHCHHSVGNELEELLLQASILDNL